jgi:exosortase
MRFGDVLSGLRANPLAAVLVGGFTALCLWVYWPTLVEMADRWVNDPQYSHGYLVPAFALVLLYMRRGQLAGATFQADWRGLPLIAAGAVGFVVGGFTYFDWLTAASLLPTLAGLAVLFGGLQAIKWAWPAIAFLLFMIPLPYRVETALGGPLQSVATRGSEWVLQTLGFAALAEGNVILLEHGRIAVVEACNGLAMLLTFAALATGMAIVVRRPLLDRIVLLVSAVPVAVLVNIVRISATGVAMELWGADVAHELFHDQAGWLMMPLAIGILWLELWVLSRLLVEVPDQPAVAPMAGFSVPAGRMGPPPGQARAGAPARTAPG